MVKDIFAEKRYISWEQFEKDIKVLVTKIKKHCKEEQMRFKAICAVPRGGVVVGVRLSHLLGIPLSGECAFNTLIVDDVSDTGKTLSRAGLFLFPVATLYRKDGTIVEPRFCVRTINKWIVFPWEIGGVEDGA